MVPGPAYRIETSRLVLRCWNPSDAPLLQRAITESIEHLRPWMPWVHEEPEDIQAKIQRLRCFRGEFDLGKDFVYGVFDQAEMKVLGGTGLHTRAGERAREIGYWIHVDHLRQGYATELTTALTRVAFEVDAVQRVEIKCDPRNQWSAAVPRKVGFRLEETKKGQSAGVDGEPRDTMIWAMDADDYSVSHIRITPLRAFDVVGRNLLTPVEAAAEV